jgi:hypothetical protein
VLEAAIRHWQHMCQVASMDAVAEQASGHADAAAEADAQLTAGLKEIERLLAVHADKDCLPVDEPGT